MESQFLILVGGGGHAAVVAGAADHAGLQLAGVIDDQTTTLTERLGKLGDLHDLESVLDEFPHAGWVLAVGDLPMRRRLLQHLSTASLGRALTVLDPAAVIRSNASMGVGTFVAANATLQPHARLGAHTIVNTGAIVEHDCMLGENVHIAPGAVLGGGVIVGDDTLVGLGARIKPGVTIGRDVTVGVGAVVLGDIDDGATVVGNPARVLTHGN